MERKKNVFNLPQSLYGMPVSANTWCNGVDLHSELSIFKEFAHSSHLTVNDDR